MSDKPSTLKLDPARVESRKRLEQMHPADRFKAMFGLPFNLPTDSPLENQTKPHTTMPTKLEAIAAAKTFRRDADELLQRMKDYKKLICAPVPDKERGVPFPDDIGEVIAQHILSIRDLESCIMRQGMALKYVGNPDPYPESRDPASTVVAPTADGLKM